MSSSSNYSSVAIIITSTRTPRIGPEVAKFVKETLEMVISDKDKVKMTLVDLATFNLPVYNEPVVPHQVPHEASFRFEHSRRWSAEILKHDGYVFVIPEYNCGMSGGTKNAIDYLRNEWIGKPAIIISYGISGGKVASEQVATILGGMGLVVSSTRPQLAFAAGTADSFAAAEKGEIGIVSLKAWDKTRPKIVEAFDDLREAIGQQSQEGT